MSDISIRLLIKRSWPAAKSLVVLHSDRSSVSEVVVQHSHWMQVVHSDIHVQTCLDIVLWLPQLFKLLCSPAQRVGQSLVFLRHPASLHCCLLLLVSLFLLIFTEQSCNWFDSLLRVDLAMVASRLLTLTELRLRSISTAVVLLQGKLAFVLRDIVGVFLLGRMLNEGGLEVRTIHEYWSFTLYFLRIVFVQQMVVGLNWFDLRVRMQRSAVHVAEVFVEWPAHLLQR